MAPAVASCFQTRTRIAHKVDLKWVVKNLASISGVSCSTASSPPHPHLCVFEEESSGTCETCKILQPTPPIFTHGARTEYRGMPRRRAQLPERPYSLFVACDRPISTTICASSADHNPKWSPPSPPALNTGDTPATQTHRGEAAGARRGVNSILSLI